MDLLESILQEVIIPPEVDAELASPRRSLLVRRFIESRRSWLRIRAATSIEAIDGLHAGERAAISLAVELSADRVVIDELQGRKAASNRDLQVIGTIGILEAAARLDLLDLHESFEKIKSTDFWVSPTFLDERLARFRARTDQHVPNELPHSEE